jgi:ABC-2 type transport system permease protein
MVMVIVYSMTVTSFGLLISGLVKSFSQLSSIAPIIIMATSMLGGCYWPLEIVGSELLVNLSMITPQRWGLIAINNTIIYGNLNHIITPTIALLLMTVVFFSLGIKMIRYE